MARKSPLRAVTAADAPPVKPRTLREALDGSERDLLVTSLEKLTATIDAGVPPHALAPLMRQVRDLRRELAAMDSTDGEDDISDAANTPDETFNAEAL